MKNNLQENHHTLQLDHTFSQYTDEDWQKEMEVEHLKEPRDWTKEAFYQISLVYNFISTAYDPSLNWWDEIIRLEKTKILLGAIPLVKFRGNPSNDLEAIQKEGIQAILSVVKPFELKTSNITSTPITSEQWKKVGMKHLIIPSADLQPLSLQNICKAIEFIHWNILHGRSLYVHCKAGKGRSVLVILCYLIKYHRMSLLEALKVIKEKRPQINPSNSQIAMAQVFEKLVT